MFVPLPTEALKAPTVAEDSPGIWSTLVPIALCADTDRLIAISCELVWMTHDGQVPAVQEFHEFSFAIMVIDRSGIEEPFSTQDRTIARRYLPEASVGRVMPIVLWSLEALVRNVDPEILYRVTKSQNPPQKSLAKHNLVTNFLGEMGYEIVEVGTDRFLRTYWVMARSLTADDARETLLSDEV